MKKRMRRLQRKNRKSNPEHVTRDKTQFLSQKTGEVSEPDDRQTYPLLLSQLYILIFYAGMPSLLGRMVWHNHPLHIVALCQTKLHYLIGINFVQFKTFGIVFYLAHQILIARMLFRITFILYCVPYFPDFVQIETFDFVAFICPVKF